MYVVVVEFRIHSAYVQAFHQAIVENARLSMESEAGCHQFDVCCDPADPAFFFLYEIYEDEAAFKGHLQSPHFLAMSALTTSWVESKTVKTMTRKQP
ncbi:putative quinol monooxygenase [Acidovorax sp. BL-A-41-H1]|uniref:putative quinol monooxygenase n=1 Tax=Acidovorax sp. BL-A-41-H1 TaxID=3421102 RepID=UPI003F7AE3B3